jgi:hypothetical protein
VRQRRARGPSAAAVPVDEKSHFRCICHGRLWQFVRTVLSELPAPPRREGTASARRARRHERTARAAARAHGARGGTSARRARRRYGATGPRIPDAAISRSAGPAPRGGSSDAARTGSRTAAGRVSRTRRCSRSRASPVAAGRKPNGPGDVDLSGQGLALPAHPGDHSHSIVDGGFDEMSSATRLTAGISLMIRLEIVSSRS